jgi:hypothetical protein
MIAGPTPEEFDGMLGALGRQVEEAVLAERERCAALCVSLAERVPDDIDPPRGSNGLLPCDWVRAAFTRAAAHIRREPAPEA